MKKWMGQCNRREKPETDTRDARETTWDSICICKLRNAVTATERTYLPKQNKIWSLCHVKDKTHTHTKDKTIPVRLLKLHVNVQFYNF